ncbi:hypothetical protein [Streptomyces sp. NEAU-YJ-81]|uniref:hypothetical protein n=1 Tax=Streptomyces sp. NEAU-YJ-81 TaxID=2820288 RepID=UPI001ABC68A9|nr:hypothetical protein [Streptomyces sp. NEAU-YJ-81]
MCLCFGAQQCHQLAHVSAYDVRTGPDIRSNPPQIPATRQAAENFALSRAEHDVRIVD